MVEIARSLSDCHKERYTRGIYALFDAALAWQSRRYESARGKPPIRELVNRNMDYLARVGDRLHRAGGGAEDESNIHLLRRRLPSGPVTKFYREAMHHRTAY